MNLIVVNNPVHLPWQTNLFDVLMLTMFVSAVAYSVVQFRRGRRIYGVVLTAATVYGLVLELAGMATLNMYVQGKFLVMINWTAIPVWKGTTMMPFYVLIFYPIILFTGFKVVEALGIAKRWQAAVTGGLFMITLDAPYIIEGNLRHIVWWTWDPNFKMFQYWVGWPLADLCWQGVWDALFLYIMLWAVPRLEPSGWSNAKSFGVFAPLAALAVLVGGTILLTPLTVVTILGAPQWPLVVALVAAYVAVAATALRTASPRGRVETCTTAIVSIYVASFAAMVIANVVVERGVTQYSVVQAVGLILMTALTLYPAVFRVLSRRPDAPPELANTVHAAG